jgi:hypothetical protein
MTTTREIPPAPVVLLISLSLMAIWPANGSGLSFAGGLIEKDSEYTLMFGGVTIFALLPFALVIESEIFFNAAMLAVWCVVLVAPSLLLMRIRRKRPGQKRQAMLILFGFQFAFSFAQAAMGMLLLLGKEV